MRALLGDRAPVRVFDRARRRSRLRQSVAQLAQIVKFFGASCQEREFPLYLVLAGGAGQIFDLFFVLISRLFRQQAFIHHHSFAYVNSSTIINRALFFLVRDQTHIALSRGMATGLAGRYGLNIGRIIVMSNAAFFDAIPLDPRPVAPERTPPIRVGFLANITFDKGFVEFFEVLKRLRSLAVSYEATIAGPVQPEARSAFDALRESSAPIKYLGAVYGESKDRFYRQLDILLFPTKYVNEAEPLVIHEALRSGTYVLACDRGAIAEILGNGAGLVFPTESFVDSAVEAIAMLSADRARLTRCQREAFEQAQRLQASAGIVRTQVIGDILVRAAACSAH